MGLRYRHMCKYVEHAKKNSEYLRTAKANKQKNDIYNRDSSSCARKKNES